MAHLVPCFVPCFLLSDLVLLPAVARARLQIYVHRHYVATSDVASARSGTDQVDAKPNYVQVTKFLSTSFLVHSSFMKLLLRTAPMSHVNRLFLGVPGIDAAPSLFFNILYIKEGQAHAAHKPISHY